MIQKTMRKIMPFSKKKRFAFPHFPRMQRSGFMKFIRLRERQALSEVFLKNKQLESDGGGGNYICCSNTDRHNK